MGNKNRPIVPSTVPAGPIARRGGRHNAISNIRCVQQGMGVKYPCICFSVFHRDMPLIFMGFIFRNIYSGTYMKE